DLLVLDQNPGQDVGNLKKNQMVVLNGESLDRDRLLHPSAAPVQAPSTAGNPPALRDKVPACQIDR
ncbi:MAG: hypothetical protein ACJ79O_09065, partial [Myxococcales bacterium]